MGYWTGNFINCPICRMQIQIIFSFDWGQYGKMRLHQYTDCKCGMKIQSTTITFDPNDETFKKIFESYYCNSYDEVFKNHSKLNKEKND